MPGFRGPSGPAYAGIAGADLSNAPTGNVPFTSPFGLPVTRMKTWHAGGVQPGGATDGVPGTPDHGASGNPDVATIETVREKSPYGGVQTGHVQGDPEGAVQTRGGLPQFGVPRPLNPEQERAAWRQPPVGGAQDKLITYDRHAFMKSGYENSGRDSGQTDPPNDGPARPSLAIIQRTINYQQGTDNTLTQDDLSRPYTKNAEGMYIGEQGSGWAPVYGGTPGLWQPYGSYEGITNGPVHGIQAPVQQGAVGDGPNKVWSGPPHGLHSPTLPDYAQTIGRYQATTQMSQPRQDRPANSPIAGQSYSQTVVPQGQAGTVVSGTGPSGPNFNERLKANGWRGHA